MGGFYKYNLEVYAGSNTNVQDLTTLTLLYSGAIPFIYHGPNYENTQHFTGNAETVLGYASTYTPGLVEVERVCGITGSYSSLLNSYFPLINLDTFTTESALYIVNRNTNKVIIISPGFYTSAMHIGDISGNNIVRKTQYSGTKYRYFVNRINANDPDGNGIQYTGLVCDSDNYNDIFNNDHSYACYFNLRNANNGDYNIADIKVAELITEFIGNTEPVPDPGPTPSPDPYDPSGTGAGYSAGGGGPAGTGGTGTTGTGGLHDDSSDAIPTPSLPSSIVTGSGLFTAYNPSASQLASFANALWNMQVSDINDVLRFLFGGDAFNAVIGLHLLPVAPTTGSSQNIKLGNWDTSVSAPKITNQYVQVPFGSVLLPEYWGNCIDYAPYTKIQLALPYIGIVDVDTDDVLGSNNTLTYNIDVLSGAICATLKCEKFNLNSVIYQWSGACSVSLPFSGASYNSVLGAIAGVAAAGMGFAAMAAGPIGAALPAATLGVGAGAFSAGSAASIMGSMKGKVQKSGSFGANSGALGIMTPYFILTRPVQSVPSSWQADKGYPANISVQLGTLLGYTEVSEINLECSGTEAEKKEIIDLLKKGVLF